MTAYELEIDELQEVGVPSSDSPASHAASAADLDALSDAALDELPFGVICLGREGTILRYNLAEARLARLDRAVVLGRPFFDEIAPCTAQPEFQGRFEAFLDDVRGPASERFSYVFDFSFGAQLVTIEILRSGIPGRAYLLVNRDQILPPRSQPFRPAPALAEWEGVAPEGVLRDGRAQRFVQLPAAALGKLLSALLRLGVDSDGVLEQWGVEWGRRAAIELEAAALEEHGTTLRQMRIGDAFTLLARSFSRQGWGALAVDFAPSEESGAFTLRLERSVWQESLRAAGARQQRFNEGYFRALLGHLAGRPVAIRAVVGTEVSADGGSGSPVDLVVVGQGRSETLAALLAASGPAPTLAEILAALGRAS
jgi:photoactive yellow protein